MEIIHLTEINSTNDYAKTHMVEFGNLTAIYIDRQTSGRGRLTRKWIDTGDENLYLTIVLKPFTDLNPIYPNFTQYLSVVLSMVLEEDYKLTPQIKWPNDVLINGKKLAGILAEGTTKGGKFLGLALGIGINLNTTIDNLNLIDKPATSIFNETGEHVDKDIFLEKLLSKFCLLYHEFICNGFISVKEYYESKAQFIGEDISINVLGDIHKGIAEGITNEGSLILKESDKTNTYYIGDIL